MSRLSVLLIAIAPLLAACPPDDAAQQARLTASKWTLAAWAHAGDMRPARVASAAPSAEFDPVSGTLSGNAGCNRFSAPVTVTGSTLTVGAPAATKRACADRGVMGHESDFLRLLSRCESWALKDGKMVIYDGAGNPLLQFESAAGGAG